MSMGPWNDYRWSDEMFLENQRSRAFVFCSAGCKEVVFIYAHAYKT